MIPNLYLFVYTVFGIIYSILCGATTSVTWLPRRWKESAGTRCYRLIMETEEKQLSSQKGGFVGRHIRRVKGRIQSRIREKAIDRARTRIYLHGKRPEDYDDEILEVIVKEEEDKLKSELKDKTIVALLAALGISFWS